MTENEWETSSPHQAAAYIKTWEEKRKREEHQQASILLMLAQGLISKPKGQRPFRLDDFLPEWCKSKKRGAQTPEEIEAMFSEFVTNPDNG